MVLVIWTVALGSSSSPSDHQQTTISTLRKVHNLLHGFKHARR